jgi:phytoene dehydrogenase-like protein
MPTHYDAIIIGAGHNGLVTACYLGRAGRRVLVLERRGVVGGCCVTEEVFPGFQVSTAAYVNSLFRKEIIHDLKLHDHGFVLLERNPSSFTPFLDNRYLLMGFDDALNRREIAKFSEKDAANYAGYEAMLLRVAEVLEPTLITRPPNLLRPRLGDLWQMFGLSRAFQKMGIGMGEAIEVLTGPATTILDRWFESDELKATLATDAIIGAFASPSMPGTAYVLFHHVMGETNGKRGVWAYVKGGMGGLTIALARAAKATGKVDIRTDAEVGQIDIKDGQVKGVTLQSGETFTAPVVASNADANVTFNRLMSPKELPPEFAAAINRITYESATLKINVALSEAPDFRACPGGPGPQHRGTMHIVPSMEYIERAYDDAKYGKSSERPILECTLPTVVDPDLAPPGQHLMSIFVQYAPYKLREGDWDTHKDAFADRCFDILNEYAPNFKRSVIDRQILSPLDLERTFSLTGGNIFQGAMSLSQLFALRPVVGWADYRTPIRGLYLCGSAAHPGGGVIGAAGWNAAREILSARVW